MSTAYLDTFAALLVLPLRRKRSVALSSQVAGDMVACDVENSEMHILIPAAPDPLPAGGAAVAGSQLVTANETLTGKNATQNCHRLQLPSRRLPPVLTPAASS